jgi:hypothetical protein
MLAMQDELRALCRYLEYATQLTISWGQHR